MRLSWGLRVGMALGLSLGLWGQARAQASGPIRDRINIDIPKDQIEPTDIDQLFQALNPFFQEGKNKVALGDIAAELKIEGPLKEVVDRILPTREADAELDCVGRRCHLISYGEVSSVRLDTLNIPILGVPVVTLGKQIDIYLELDEQLARLEACRIEGVTVKVGVAQNRLDGFVIERTADGLKTLKIDVGPGGDYPKKDCAF